MTENIKKTILDTEMSIENNNAEAIIEMKTNDMERHCLLLLNKVLAECNINVINSTEREIFAYSDGCKRVISLGYVKKSSIPNKDDIHFVRITLLDNGEDSPFSSYYSEEHQSIVHDVSVLSIIIKHNGADIEFSGEKLVEINNKVLADLKKTLNLGGVTIYGREAFHNMIGLIPIVKSNDISQLQFTTLQFLKNNKDVLPEDFSGKVNFVENYEDIDVFDSKGNVNVFIESRIFEDGEPIHQYLVRANTANGYYMCISMNEFHDEENGVQIYETEGILLTLDELNDGQMYSTIIMDKDDYKGKVMLDSFAKIHQNNVPKYAI